MVVVDIGSRKTDVEPLKAKTAISVYHGFKAIYNRNILQFPNQIDVDSGSEFKGIVKDWFEHEGTLVHVGVPGRHRQLALVERRNQIIGKRIYELLLEEELTTGRPASKWMQHIRSIIDDMNSKAEKEPIEKEDDEYEFTDYNRQLLSIGTKVRTALDNPMDMTTRENLMGRFRTTDIKWDPKIKTIKEVIIQPNQPPLYLVSDDKNGTDHRMAFTRNRLQEVKHEPIKQMKTQEPSEDGYYVVEKIIDKRVIHGNVQYLVKWKGYPKSQATWEPFQTLYEDAPTLIRRYEANQLKKQLK